MLSYLLEDAKPGTSITSIILIVVLLIAFVGLIWFSSHSQKKKQKQAAEMNEALKVGDQIKSIGGIVGTIVAIDAESGNFEIQTGTTTMILDRNAVYPVNYFDAQNARAAKPVEEVEAVPAESPEAPAEEAPADEVPAEGKSEEKDSDKADKE